MYEMVVFGFICGVVVGWREEVFIWEKTLTGRRAIRVSCAVHPGWPLLRAIFVGGRIDSQVRGTSGGSGADGCRVSCRGGVDTGL